MALWFWKANILSTQVCWTLGMFFSSLFFQSYLINFQTADSLFLTLECSPNAPNQLLGTTCEKFQFWQWFAIFLGLDNKLNDIFSFESLCFVLQDLFVSGQILCSVHKIAKNWRFPFYFLTIKIINFFRKFIIFLLVPVLCTDKSFYQRKEKGT